MGVKLVFAYTVHTIASCMRQRSQKLLVYTYPRKLTCLAVLYVITSYVDYMWTVAGTIIATQLYTTHATQGGIKEEYHSFMPGN